MASDTHHRIVPATPPPALPDDLLEEVFLRLADASDLARASAACASFRRVVSGRPFLRRFRSLHAPPVLGFICSDGFRPAEPPHRSAPAARALSLSADFTFSFLPEPREEWAVRDARDGLVLLLRRHGGSDDLVVCDPLRRRYVPVPLPHYWRRCSLETFLAPGAGEDEDDVNDDKEERLAPFSVICTMQGENRVGACIFCSGGDGEWRRTVYLSSRTLPSSIFCYGYGCRRSYAHGCFFWTVDSMGFSLVLDIHEMEFSIIDLPPKPNNGDKCTIVNAGEGMLGLLTFDNSMVSLSRRVWGNNNDGDVGAEEWQPYKTNSFPKDSNGKDYHWYGTMAADDVYLLMIGRESQSSSNCSWQYHTLELQILNFERLCVSDSGVLSSHLYARFPQLLAPPII